MTKATTTNVATKSLKAVSQSASPATAKTGSLNASSAEITSFTPAKPQEITMSKPGSSSAYNSFSSAANNASSAFSSHAEEASNLFKANTEACMQSAQRMMAACNQINQSIMSLSQSMMQMGVAAVQAATSARTLRDVAEIQNDYAKSAIDACVSKSTEISELALKAANDAAAPISARINETMQQFSQRSAA